MRTPDKISTALLLIIWAVLLVLSIITTWLFLNIEINLVDRISFKTIVIGHLIPVAIVFILQGIKVGYEKIIRPRKKVSSAS